MDDKPCDAGFHKNDIGLCVADTDLDCPEGYEPNADGTQCIPVVEIVDDKPCDAGFHKNDIGLCVADTDLDCPEGYEPNADGTQCIPVVEIVDKKCDPGFVYDETLKKCVAIKTTECDPGFHKNDIGLCVADTDLDCPEGYEPNEAGTECIPIVEIVDKKCDAGFVYDEDLKKCVAIKTTECDAGFHKNDIGLCVADTDLDCPEGYEPNADGTKCIPVVEIVDKKCDPGFVYDEELKKCVAIKTTECDDGFHDDGTGFCVPDDEECKPGFERIDNVCVPVCKEGYIRNLATNVCEKEEKACPPGQVKDANGKCVPIVKPPPPPPPPVVKTTPTTYVPSTGVSASGEKTDPIYATGMDDFDLFATLEELLADKPDKTDKKKDSKKSKEKTKMASGGHLDDLLAEQMTVDDLLNLLR